MRFVERLIESVSPSWAAKRAQARATLQQINALTGSTGNAYAAAKLSRLNSLRLQPMKENEIGRNVYDKLRADSWHLYRNNASARKIVRSLQAKIVGRGLSPDSLAMNENGNADVAFRARAKRLWAELQSGFDARGVPGKGGLSMIGLQKLALKAVILSGETLYRLRALTPQQQRRLGLPIPLALQLIDSARLADEYEITAGTLADGHKVCRGIELDANDQRVAYWIRNVSSLSAATATGGVSRVPVDAIGHLFIEDDIDQLGGVPWFAPAIIGIQDTGDLQYNVLKQSAMAACIVGSYAKPTGATRVGLNASTVGSGTSDGTDLTDADGNTVSKIQPAMLINVGKDGKFDLHSPNQPNMNPEGFVQHLQRGTATAFPGIKSSTLTGDYRNSSFSSERSADNDNWPELYDVQDWFAAGFCQPIYEAVIRVAVFSGYFDGIVSPEEFQANPTRYCQAKWQGPIPQSINPVDDAQAASLRIKGGISSLQMECAKLNVNWQDVLNDHAEVYAVAKQKGIPPEVVNNIFGVDAQDQLAAQQMQQEQETPQEETVDA